MKRPSATAILCLVLAASWVVVCVHDSQMTRDRDVARAQLVEVRAQFAAAQAELDEGPPPNMEQLTKKVKAMRARVDEHEAAILRLQRAVTP